MSGRCPHCNSILYQQIQWGDASSFMPYLSLSLYRHALWKVQEGVIEMFKLQMIHVRNGCISNEIDHLPYVRIDAVHSVLDRNFYTQHGIGMEIFDARLGWWILSYNRRRLRALGKKIPPDTMPPKVCL